MDTKNEIKQAIADLEKSLLTSVMISEQLRICRRKCREVIKLAEDIEKCLPTQTG